MVVLKYFIGFFLLLAMIVEWVAELVKDIFIVIHKAFEAVALALLKKYNEFNS